MLGDDGRLTTHLIYCQPDEQAVTLIELLLIIALRTGMLSGMHYGLLPCCQVGGRRALVYGDSH